MILEARDVWHTYDQDGQRFHALRGVDLAIAAGEFVALVGANGSGKTTLSKHFNGLLRPTRGTVLVAGEPTRRRTVAQLARTVGFVFQNPDHQIFCDSVAAEVSFALRLRGLRDEQVRERTRRALQAVGLERHGDRHPRTLSGGQRQRLATASVLALETEVVVLDEPTTGQDYLARRQIMELAAGLHRAGRTILMVTHDMALVAEYATRAIVLHGGRVLCDTTPAQVFARADVVAAADLQVPPIVQLARAWEPYGVAPTATTAAEVCAALRAARRARGRDVACP